MRLRDLDADVSHLRETTTTSEQVWKGRLLDVRRDEVRLPDGHLAHREYIVHPGAVMVVALLDAERLVVERQWRHPIGQALLEFPAGKLEAGEPVLSCAVRELFEETGYRAAEWARAGITHNAIAYATEAIEIWFARGLTAGARRLDHGEFLDVLEATADELEAAACRGELTDAKTLVGLLWLRQWREGRWPLEWRPAPD
jgi:ADP-ribose pyrophosphatase